MEEDRTHLYILSIVAVVAIIAIVIFVKNEGNSGADALGQMSLVRYLNPPSDSCARCMDYCRDQNDQSWEGQSQCDSFCRERYGSANCYDW